MVMLLQLCRQGLPLEQLPIATVYLHGNRGSHFRPLWDSLRIACTVVRYVARRTLRAAFAVCERQLPLHVTA